MIILDSFDGRPNPQGMVCDPVFPVLRINGTLAQIQTQLELDKDGEWSRSTAAGTPSQSALAAMSQTAKEIQSALVHEEDHLKRQFSTSYGLLQAIVRHQFLWKISGILHENLAQDRVLRLPLLPTCESILRSDFLTQYESYQELDQIGQYSSLALANLELQKLLEGGYDSNGYPLADLLLAQWAEAGFFGTGSSYQWMGKAAVADIVSQRGHRFRFGGLQIFEHFAVLNQLEHLRLMNADTESFWHLLTNQSRTYLMVLRRWQQAVSDDSSNRFSDESVRAEGLHQFPVEHFAMLDLAMWPPFVPTPEVLKGRAWLWSDINPWLRWERMLSVWEDWGRPMMFFAAADRNNAATNQAFRDFQHRLCQELDWPTPKTLSFLWTHWFQANLPREENPVLSPFWEPTLKVGLSLLHRRQTYPLDAVLGTFISTDSPRIRFNVWAHQGTSPETVDFTAVNSQGEVVLEKYLLAQTTRWLANETGVFKRLIPERQREGIDLLMQIFEIENCAQKKTGFLRAVSGEVEGIGEPS